VRIWISHLKRQYNTYLAIAAEILILLQMLIFIWSKRKMKF